jgi:hypothetical protein
MLDHHAFIVQFQQLCHAFGRRLEIEMIWQYYRSLQKLTEPQVAELFRWAIENVKSGFPAIAVLKEHAETQGWRASQVSHPGRENPVIVICPECGGSFTMTRTDLQEAIQTNRSFRCVNSDYWHCPKIFSARDISERHKP